VVVALTSSDANAPAARTVALSVASVTRTFSLPDGLSPAPVTFGVYLPSSATGMVAVAALASGAGVHAESLRVRCLRPVETLLQIIAERRPPVVIFGPDADRLSRVGGGLSRRAYGRAWRRLARRVDCLLWRPDDEPAGAVRARPDRRFLMRTAGRP